MADSIAALAGLEPQVLATGHGRPLVGAATPRHCMPAANQVNAGTHRPLTSPTTGRRVAPGFLRPVDCSSRTRYRRPPGAYLHLQWLGHLQRVRVVGEGGDGKDRASVGDAGLSTGKLPAARAGDGLTSAASWSARRAPYADVL